MRDWMSELHAELQWPLSENYFDADFEAQTVKCLNMEAQAVEKVLQEHKDGMLPSAPDRMFADLYMGTACMLDFVMLILKQRTLGSERAEAKVVECNEMIRSLKDRLEVCGRERRAFEMTRRFHDTMNTDMSRKLYELTDEALIKKTRDSLRMQELVNENEARKQRVQELNEIVSEHEEVSERARKLR
jgi:hypothetical protein